jgi:hypothetical protein
MSPISQRCQYCLSFSIQGLNGDGEIWGSITHQPSFSALRLSAESGCDLCGYFIRALTCNGRPLPTDYHDNGQRNGKSENPVLIGLHKGNIINPRRDETVDRLVFILKNGSPVANIALSLFTKRRMYFFSSWVGGWRKFVWYSYCNNYFESGFLFLFPPFFFFFGSAGDVSAVRLRACLQFSESS